jgi:Tol biopolymer transport system component
MQLTMRPAFMPGGTRRLILIVAVGLLALALVASGAFIASQRRLPPAFGPASNGAIVVGVGTELWLMDLDGSHQRRLDIGPGGPTSPAFSPDGTKLTFMSRSADGRPFSLFVANADGTGARLLSGDMPIVSEFPGAAWSPDGSTLVFHSSDQGVNRLYSVGVDGTGLHAITDKSADRSLPAWSPDGKWLAYRMEVVDEETSDMSLAISRPDGTAERRLLTKTGPHRASFSGSQWAGNSDRIAYFRSDDLDTHLVGVVDLKGVETILSAPGEDAVNPAVSPDGRRLIYGKAYGSTIVDLFDPSKRVAIPGALAECGAVWAPDATALLGSGLNCARLYWVPLDKPSAAAEIALPKGSISGAAWQRLAP